VEEENQPSQKLNSLEANLLGLFNLLVQWNNFVETIYMPSHIVEELRDSTLRNLEEEKKFKEEKEGKF
jgi:hypothetical protein